MEIPYIVNSRKDTGLNNSKIAIWLFLASEVMLFGGLFSSYIFLRVFADYPWPERALPVLPGLINTFILIASSVTVVFAWAGLKLRKWGMFVGNMAFTIVCAVIFMVFKAKEYSGKFHHHGSQTNDYGWVEGHLKYDKADPTHGNAYVVVADEINFSIDSTTPKYLATLIEQGGDKLTLAAPYKVREITGDQFTEKVLFAAGTKLSLEVISEAKLYFIAARTHNQELRTQLLKDAWVEVRDPALHPELVGFKDFDSKVKAAVTDAHNALVKKAEANNEFLLANGNMVFNANGAEIKLDTGWGRISNSIVGAATNVSLLDGTVLSGIAGDSNFVYKYIDALDFRHLVMKAEEKNLHVDDLIEKSPILNIEGEGGDKIRKIWETHKVWRGFLTKELLTQKDWLTGVGRVPTEVDLYRVTWHQMVAYAALDYKITAENWMQVKGDHQPSMIHDITGITDEHKMTFPKEVTVPRDQVRFDSVFSPKMNNYYAIYFTITGLHGLHVIGGAIVLSYYLFFGRKMFLSNPEWLANRVEVGGLFWHFVDLVWIFVFPIFYLM